MSKNQQNQSFESKEPPVGLFDRIIFSIRKEQGLRQTKRILFGFFALFMVSIFAVPISGMMFVVQIKKTGALYIISTAFRDMGMFIDFWQDFSMAIIESLPIVEIIIFMLAVSVAVFMLRLFLHRRKMLFGYLIQSFNLK